MALFGSLLVSAQTIHIESGATLYTTGVSAVNGMASATPTLKVMGSVSNSGILNNNGEIQISGDISGTGVLTSTGDEVLNGSTNQTLSGNLSGSSMFYNLVLDKSGGDVQLNTNTGVMNQLRFTNEKIVGNGNMLMLTNTSNTAIQNAGASGSTSRYVEGVLMQNVMTGQTYTFPVGDATHGCQSAQLNFANTGGGTAASVGYSSSGSGSVPNQVSCDNIFDKKSGTWTVGGNGTNGTYNYGITLLPAGANVMTGINFDALKRNGFFITDSCAGTTGNLSQTGLTTVGNISAWGGELKNLTICNYGTATMSGNNSLCPGKVWSTTGDGAFNDNTLANAVYTPGPNDKLNGSVVLTYSGCAMSQSMTLTILPPVTAMANTPLCTGMTLNLMGSAGGTGTYAWSGPGGFTGGSQNESIPNAQPSNSGSYMLTFTSGTPGCSGSASVNVFVGPMALTVNPDPVDGTLAHTVISNCTPNYTLFWRRIISGSTWSSMNIPGNTPDITGLLPATAYMAYVVDANGATSSLVYFTTSGVPFCGQAPTLTASANCDKIFADWSTGLLYSQYSVSFRQYLPVLGATASSYSATTSKVFTITPANFGKTYEVSVSGMCDNQYSIAATPVYVTVPDPRPESPSGLIFSGITCNAITTSWSPVANAVGYRVRFRNTVSGTTFVNFYTTGTSYTRTGLSGGLLGAGFTYEIWVVPVGCSNLLGTESQHYFVTTCNGNVNSGGARPQAPDPEHAYDGMDNPELDIVTDAIVSVYPNPNNGSFTVSAGDMTAKSALVEVVNMLGQVLYTQEVSTEDGTLNHEVHLDNSLSIGTYLVRVKSSDKTILAKFVKSQN